MKVSEFLDKNVYAQGMNVGRIINVIVDMEENYLVGKVKDLYGN